MHKRALKKRVLTGAGLVQAVFALIFLFSLVGAQPTAAQPPDYTWEAFNDCAVAGTVANPANTTVINCYTNGATGKLKNFATGAVLDVSVTVNTSGSVDSQLTPDSLLGVIPADGTDAYNLFNGKASIIGGVRLYNTKNSKVTLTISGLNAGKTYTFATTANRNRSDYTGRISGFTLSDFDSAVNKSSSGATIEGMMTKFWTGNNTATGYVARWENISPGADGKFVVTITNEGTSTTAYGPFVFYLAEEIIIPKAITITADDKVKAVGDPDPVLTYTITEGVLADGDEIIGALARDPGEKPDTYAITLGSLAINNGENYDLTFIEGTLTIEPYQYFIPLLYR